MKILRFATIVLLFIGLLSCQSRPAGQPVSDSGELNRYPAKISYSKHARCRMECRNIDEHEIADILHHGYINYRKSNLSGDDCHKRYALEGYENGEKLRIIVASCGNETTVITCIDLSHDWPCHCPGDERHY